MSETTSVGSVPGRVPGAGEASASDQLFARQATGLVRELSPRHSVFLILSYISLPLGLLLITQVGATFPGVNVGLAFLVTLVVLLPQAVTYGLLSQAMPRSGGEYLFLSRALHPFVAYVINATSTLWQVFGASVIVLLVPTFALPALFQGLAISTGDASWIDAATTVSKEGWQFGIAAAITVGSAILMLLNLRLAMRIFSVLVVLSLVGVATTFIALLFIDNGDFVNRFAEHGSVNEVIAAARADGLGDTSLSLGPTLAAVVLLNTTLGVSIVSSSWAGETRRASSTGLRTILVSLIGAAVGFAAISFLAVNAFGSSFLASAQFVSNSDAWPLDGPPFLNMLITVAAPHTWLVLLLGITYVAGMVAIGPPIFLLATRTVFAHAFERVLPARLATVNPRTHSPVAATLLVLAFMLGFQALYVFSSLDLVAYLAVSALLAFVVWGSVGIAGAVFPFRQRAMYEASPIKRELLGVPVLSIVGTLAAVLMAVYLVVLVDSKYSSVLGATAHDPLVALAVVVVMFAAIWIVAWLHSRRAGLSIARASGELPPE
jgi:APA family basic amino acid/polyamine antiporter